MAQEPEQPEARGPADDSGDAGIPGESAPNQDLTLSFSGPLPPPNLLRQYQDIQPDFPERLLSLTEQEAAHRRDVTRKAMRLDAVETVIGQVFGLVVALAAMTMVGYLGYLGYPVASVVFGFGALSSLVAVFVWGRRGDKNGNASGASD
jgi:uncharacterized membrane protein